MSFCCCKDEIQRVTTTLTSMNIRCLTKSCRSSVPYMSPPNYKLWVSPFIEGQSAKTFYDILCRWRSKSCGRATQRLSRHDNTSAHNALSIQQFLAEQNLVMLDQTSDSPDLDQPPFTKFKGVISETFFEDGCDDRAEEDSGRILPGLHEGQAQKTGNMYKEVASMKLVVWISNNFCERSPRTFLTHFLLYILCFINAPYSNYRNSMNLLSLNYSHCSLCHKQGRVCFLTHVG